jgi:subtilase family serine protease
VAPGATIDPLFANQLSPADMCGASNYSLKQNLDYQLSNSHGKAGCDNRKCNNTVEQGIRPCTTITHVDIDQILADAAAHRVTVLAAAGDSEAWLEEKQLVKLIPSDCMRVLTVGGTSLWCLPWARFMAGVNHNHECILPAGFLNTFPYTAKSTARMAPLLITQGISMTSRQGTTPGLQGLDGMPKRSSTRS